MFGQNPKRPAISGNGEELEIQSVFKTLQGEGPFAGYPAIFIRLGGCNLACSFCDTEFENFITYQIDTLLNEVQRLANNIIKLVVITGGEPLRQPIELLCKQLLKLSYIVQIETNGTFYRALPQEVNIVCSPKVSANKSGGYAQIRIDLLPHIAAIKFLVAKNLPQYNEVAEIGQSLYNIPVYVQPIDQNDDKLNKDNLELAMKIALEKNYRLSIQLHKILGIE